MEPGKQVFSGIAENCRKFKRDTYIWMSAPLIFILFWVIFNYVFFGIILIINDWRVVVLFIFSIGCILYVLIGIGMKINLFAVYENGISPPSKPWSKVFDKEYFIPYSEIKSVNIESAPVYYELHLKNGKKIAMRGWPLYNFISEREHKKVEKYMKKIHDFIANENEKEMKGEKADWTFKG